MALRVKNPPANAGNTGDAGWISGLGRSPGEGNGNPLQYSCLENSMDRGDHAWSLKESDNTKQLTHTHTQIIMGFPGDTVVESACQCRIR